MAPPQYLRDLRRDDQTGRIFVTTSDDQLIVLDGSAYVEAGRFGFGGDLTLDEANRRLYAAPGDRFVPEGETPTIHVIDLDTMEEIATIDGEHTVSLDVAGGRLFAGSPFTSQDSQADLLGVGVYDLATLELLSRFEQPGVPTYNPLRDELLITAYTVLVADPDDGSILQDLMPHLQEQPFAWCNGCEVADSAHVFEREGLLVVERDKVHTAPGPGSGYEPLYFDAATLEPVERFDRRLPLQFMCGSQPLLLPAIDNVIYRQPYFIRYLAYRNFVAHSLDGEVIAWRDGLFAPFVDPRTRQAFVTQGYVVNLADLTPLGEFPTFCPLATGDGDGRIYGRSEGDLLVIDDTGGTPMSALPAEPELFPKASVRDILVSPGYPVDPTIFAVLEDGRVFRTADDASSWTRIQGGLPSGEPVHLVVAMSPDFATDRTLFAGGFTGDYQGAGVLRSTDGGDTWTPMWNGLSMLRVYDVIISPDYSQNGTVQAFSNYHDLTIGEYGVGMFESQDRGLSWSLVLTATDQAALETQGDVATSGMPAPELPVRIADYGSAVEMRIAGSDTWTRLDLGQKDNEMFRAVVPSPTYETDGIIYVLGEFGLWRTKDRGLTWSRWDEPRLANRTYENALYALAVSPVMPDGGHKLFVGSYAGEFWILTPSGAGGSPAGIATPAVQTSPEAAPIEAPPQSAPREEPEQPSLPAEPPAGAYWPQGALASLWEGSEQTQRELGYALQESATAAPAAYQSFERGSMIWRGDTRTILVLFSGGEWRAYSDTFEEGEPESDPSLTAPAGVQQPLRGFGKLWRSEQEVREGLGWALDKEQGYTATIQQFERGFLLGSPIGARVFVEMNEDGGRWY